MRSSPSIATRDAEAREAEQRRAKVLDAGRLDADLRSRDGGESDERPDLDVIRPDAVRAATDRLPAVDGDGVRADPIDLRAERAEEMREVLHVRLAGGVAKDRRASRGGRRDERVLRRGHARLVEKDVGADERLRAQLELLVGRDVGAESLEREEVRVEPTTTDDVAAGRRQRDLTAAREQRAGEQDRRANLSAEIRIEIGRPDGLRVDVAACCDRSTPRSRQPSAPARRASRCRECAGRSRA